MTGLQRLLSLILNGQQSLLELEMRIVGNTVLDRIIIVQQTEGRMEISISILDTGEN